MDKQKLPNPKVAVGAIIFDPLGRVLLIRRGKEPAQGQWSVPGGKQEAGETLVEACRREVLEETSIEVNLQSITAVVERITEGFHYLIVDFVAFPVDPTPPMPIAASDVTAAVWIPLITLKFGSMLKITVYIVLGYRCKGFLDNINKHRQQSHLLSLDILFYFGK